MNIIVEVSAFRGNIHIPWISSAFVEISPFCGYYPHFVDICVLRGYYPHFEEISMLCRYYPHFVEISTSHEYYPHFVDMIYIDHITSYLDRTVCPIFPIYSVDRKLYIAARTRQAGCLTRMGSVEILIVVEVRLFQ